MGSGASRTQKQSTSIEVSTVPNSQSNTEMPLTSIQAVSPNRLSPSRSDGNFSPNSELYPDSGQSSPTDREEDAALRAHFAQSAMSLGMDNEDLIFNLLYFSDAGANFQSMFNSAIEETVAAHSAGNTPYKLQPATKAALDKLRVSFVTSETILEEKECAICQEEMELGSEIVFMPDCRHCFHEQCVKRWFTLQSWCPVCRTQILSTEAASAADDDEYGMVQEKIDLTSRFHECMNGRCQEDDSDEDADSGGSRGVGGWQENDPDEDENSDTHTCRESTQDASTRYMVANCAVERALRDAVSSRLLQDSESIS